jgi:hypothetical protein
LPSKRGVQSAALEWTPARAARAMRRVIFMASS